MNRLACPDGQMREPGHMTPAELQHVYWTAQDRNDVNIAYVELQTRGEDVGERPEATPEAKPAIIPLTLDQAREAAAKYKNPKFERKMPKEDYESDVSAGAKQIALTLRARCDDWLKTIKKVQGGHDKDDDFWFLRDIEEAVEILQTQIDEALDSVGA